jgi:LysM repeat protein
VIHTVQAYQTLSTISEAYHVSVDRILSLNGIQVDWPLQIGQELLIDPGHVTPSPTPRPLTAVEKLTPESDGKYYHTINSGETLSWIAQLYEINLADLLAWNGLNASSIIHPGEKLVLQVTPPATITPTPVPVTISPTTTPAPATSTPTLTPTRPVISQTSAADPASTSESTRLIWFLSIGLALGGLTLVVMFSRKKW